MTKSQIIEEVNRLVKKNEIEKAFKVLHNAQYSKNDTTLTLLHSNWEQVKKQVVLSQLSAEEESRMVIRINRALLQLAQNIDPEEIELNKSTKQQAIDIEDTKPNKANDSSDTWVTVRGASKLNFSKRYLILFLIIPLCSAILWHRTAGTDNPSGGSTGKKQDITDHFLKSSKSIWSSSDYLYLETFSDRNNPTFRPDIWKEESRNRDYSMSIEDKRYYKIQIKTDKDKNSFSRNKFLGRYAYDASKDIVPFSVKVLIDESATCKGGTFCLGRGISLRYHHGNKSAYVFTLNDNGRLQFRRLNDFNNPRSGRTLFSKEIQIKKGKNYELGVVAKENRYFLFLNRKFLFEVVEKQAPLEGRYVGVFASGKGNHLFESLRLGSVLNN